MTTIAYRNGVIAADTACTSGDTKQAHIYKIAHNLKAGIVAGAAGRAGWASEFLKRAEEIAAPDIDMLSRPGLVPEQTDNTLDRGIVIMPDKKTIHVYEPDGMFVMVDVDYYAFGSGKDIALGAMAAGASAPSAIQIAIRHDAHTGGEVYALGVPDPAVRG